MGIYGTACFRILKVMKDNRFFDDPKSKSVVMIGKQNMLVRNRQVKNYLLQLKIPHDESYWNNPSIVADNLFSDSYAFFSMLGITDVHALDYSDYEGADILCDLNGSIPAKHLHRFDLVIDAGTTEHVFDIARATFNVSELVKEDGIVIHINAGAGYINHGFYSISPTLYLDFYSLNGFDILNLDLETMYCESGFDESVYSFDRYADMVSVFTDDLRVFDDDIEDWAWLKLNKVCRDVTLSERFGHTYIWCIAKRTEIKECNYPIQGMYQSRYKMDEDIKSEANENKRTITDDDIKEYVERDIAQEPENGISIFCTGDVANRIADEIYKHGYEDRVCCIYDSNVKKAGISFRSLGCVKYPTRERLCGGGDILICTDKYEDEVEAFLLDNGVGKERIKKI